MKFRQFLLALAGWLLFIVPAGTAHAAGIAADPQTRPALALKVVAPPDDVVRTFGLKPFYAKYVSVGGMPVVASAKVPDAAVLEAAFLVDKMIGHRPDVLRAMADKKVRLAVMGYNQFTTDIPEHSDLSPASYWNKRARGLGATPERPAVSGAEENLLCYKGDPYTGENITIHEFAHAIHEMGLSKVDPTFDRRLRQAYAAAMKSGLWKGTYAATNRMEYWAEGTQSWFDTNLANNSQHNDASTREKVKAYDPALAALLTEVYGDGPWRYTRPVDRPAGERSHLTPANGYDPDHAPRFTWPRELKEAADKSAEAPAKPGRDR